MHKHDLAAYQRVREGSSGGICCLQGDRVCAPHGLATGWRSSAGSSSSCACVWSLRPVLCGAPSALRCENRSRRRTPPPTAPARAGSHGLSHLSRTDVKSTPHRAVIVIGGEGPAEARFMRRRVSTRSSSSPAPRRPRRALADRPRRGLLSRGRCAGVRSRGAWRIAAAQSAQRPLRGCVRVRPSGGWFGPNVLAGRGGRRWPRELASQLTHPLALFVVGGGRPRGRSGSCRWRSRS